jgi:hypothetical protein
MKRIEYKGKVLETKHFHNLPDEECESIRNDMLALPTIKEVKDNIKTFHKGNNRITDITEHFFKELMYKTKMYHSKWSLWDALHYDDIIRYFYAKTLQNPKFFDEYDTIKRKMECSIRTTGKGTACKIANFTPKSVDMILDKYNVNNNYYDFSCGWGVRLMTSMRARVNYFGTDPNVKLVPRLKEFAKLYNDEIGIKTKVDIRCQGSEVFVPEWENTMGLAFTSPPYFGLEDYKFGNQSVQEDTTYKSWLSDYMDGTIKNIKRYLIDDGVLAINIKGYSKYELYEDTKQVCLDNGFILFDEIDFINNRRQNVEIGKTDELIMIMKKNNNPIVTYNSIEDMFE